MKFQFLFALLLHSTICQSGFVVSGFLFPSSSSFITGTTSSTISISTPTVVPTVTVPAINKRHSWRYSPWHHRCNGNHNRLNESRECSSNSHDDASSKVDINIKQYNTLPRLFVGTLSNSLPQSQLQSHSNAAPAPSLLKDNSIIRLSMEQTHYLSKVMRLFAKKKKEHDLPLIRIFDGINGEWLCQILPPDIPMNQGKQKRRTINRNIDGNHNSNNNSNSNTPLLQAKCIQQLRQQSTSTSQPCPWLFFAPIKKQRAKIMVEKCTELGAHLFCPILTEYTDAIAAQACIGNMDIDTASSNNQNQKSHHDDHQNNGDAIMFEAVSSKAKKKSVEKLSLVACEASEQCERLGVPSFVTKLEFPSQVQFPSSRSKGVVTPELLLQEWTDSESMLGTDRLLLVCRERTEERTNVLSILDAMDKAAALDKDVAFLVGPEGGWSPQEEAWFDEYTNQHSEAVMGVSLGSNVLRAETASILAIGSVALWSTCSSSKMS